MAKSKSKSDEWVGPSARKDLSFAARNWLKNHVDALPLQKLAVIKFSRIERFLWQCKAPVYRDSTSVLDRASIQLDRGSKLGRKTINLADLCMKPLLGLVGPAK